MQSELEALVLALEAVKQARSGEEAKRLEAPYQARIDEVVARRPNVPRERVMQSVALAHSRWVRAQEKKFPSMPPRA